MPGIVAPIYGLMQVPEDSYTSISGQKVEVVEKGKGGGGRAAPHDK